MEHEARHWVRLAAACNNRCLFCLDAASRMGEIIPFDAVIEELRRGREQGIARVVLSGGEPLIHPRFLDIVAQAKGMGYTHIQAISNGRRYARADFVERCVAAGLRETTLSMHGHTAQLHDRLAGVPGAFKEALAGLVNVLKRPELIVSVDIVLNKLNMEVIDDVMWFYTRLGVREFDLLHVVPFASAWEHWETLDYDPEKTRERFHRALLLARNMGATLWTNRLRARHLEGFESLIQDPSKLHDEVRGRGEMFQDFLTSGRMMHCRGERCRFCFMESWCGDLVALKKKGRMKGRPRPECLSGGADKKGEAVFRWDGPDTDLSKWTDFFIARRYNVKGSACKTCAYDKTCAGANIGFIKAEGFQALKAAASRARRPRRIKQRDGRKTCRS